MAKQLETVTISELMRNPSAVFRRVQRTRKRLCIMRRGGIIAEIAPCASKTAAATRTGYADIQERAVRYRTAPLGAPENSPAGTAGSAGKEKASPARDG